MICEECKKEMIKCKNCKKDICPDCDSYAYVYCTDCGANMNHN